MASSNGTAIAGTDYTEINQTITFAEGETSKTVSIASIEDTTTESDETFTLTLMASSTDTVPAQITDGSATVTITDDDVDPNTFIRGSSYYQIVKGPTWLEAETAAIDLGGHLVTINDKQEVLPLFHMMVVDQ